MEKIVFGFSKVYFCFEKKNTTKKCQKFISRLVSLKNNCLPLDFLIKICHFIIKQRSSNDNLNNIF